MNVGMLEDDSGLTSGKYGAVVGTPGMDVGMVEDASGAVTEMYGTMKRTPGEMSVKTGPDAEGMLEDDHGANDVCGPSGGDGARGLGAAAGVDGTKVKLADENEDGHTSKDDFWYRLCCVITFIFH